SNGNQHRVCQPKRLAPEHWTGTPGWESNHNDNDTGTIPQNARHTGGATYIFFDGHAKWYKIEATIRPNNLWTIDPNDCSRGKAGLSVRCWVLGVGYRRDRMDRSDQSGRSAPSDPSDFPTPNTQRLTPAPSVPCSAPAPVPPAPAPSPHRPSGAAEQP